MSMAVHRGPAEDHVRALLRLVCVATALGAASGASHASMTDSSSSLEAARRPSLRLGFVDEVVLAEELRPALGLLLRASRQNQGPHIGAFQIPQGVV